jgi:PAS domain S-box-containing protein
VQDITERKQTEEALRASEELYTRLVNAIPDIIVHTDLEGNIFFVNDYALQMSGYSREEIVGKNLLTFLSPENHEDIINNLLLMTQARLGPREYNLIIKDGKKIPIEVNGDVLRNEDGTPFGLVNVCRDIRERKRAEESLHAWMRRYDLIVEASGEIAYEYTISTGDILWGRSIENVLGYSQDEISEGFTQWQDLLHPDDRPGTLELLAAAEKTCSYWDVQYRMRHKNGHYVWLRDRGFFLPDSGGRAYSQLGMLDDVTEHRLAEEKLQQTLESLKNAVGTTIQVLVSALEARDPYTSGHQSRTAHLACAIATEMGFSQDKIEGIRMAGSIHDIGKLSIPAEILVKPTKLSDLEYSLIKEHARAGYEMLKDVESPWPLAEIVHQHHERMNGSGYPKNLKGDEIIPEARIMAVADVVEAMASHRPYRAALGLETALEEIEKNKGILYDDAVADACLKLFREKGYQLLTVKS